VSGARGC